MQAGSSLIAWLKKHSEDFNWEKKTTKQNKGAVQDTQNSMDLIEISSAA